MHMMQMPLIIQTTILSGALGFVSLNVLQHHDAVSNYISKTDANYYRILFGIIDYFIYFAIMFFVTKRISENELAVSISMGITMVIGWITVRIYGYIRRKRADKIGYQPLSSRETAFSDSGDGIGTRVDIFKLDGTHFQSGYLEKYDADADLPGDFILKPLQEGESPVKTEAEVLDKGLYQRIYVDLKNGLKFYITATSY